MSIDSTEVSEGQQQNVPIEDPLIAALPPKTDYITYLTILEYNLGPQNLSTLNRLLQQDDGTLASEIGWDLLKLVLPILRVEPTKAKECLDIIARRGNPREVIVKIAEELETLGQDESEGEADPQEHEDGLPTFVGEAPHVHLGEMKLAGMPEAHPPQTVSSEDEEQAPGSAVEEIKLSSLLAMLAVLHPRIKTQHPSRFLATSLPAALGAYRRLTLTSDSTIAFLRTLFKLVNQKRPPLPPRTSTTDVLKQIPTDLKPVSIPAPDPETSIEALKLSEEIAENEKAINLRLVQAVYFEILEEYTAASSEAQPPLTSHLRSIFEPRSLLSHRRADVAKLLESTEGQSARSLRKLFVATANDLQVNIKTEILNLDKPKPEVAEAEEEHEYPTAPSQIPFSNTGLLLLRCAQVYLLAEKEQKPLNPPVNLQHILPTILRSWKNDARFKSSPPAIDSLLAMFYMGICAQAPPPLNAPFVNQDQIQPTLIGIYDILREIFTHCPDADLRDNAHHIATHLLHGHANRETRIQIIRDLLDTPSVGTASSLMSFGAQPGDLKSLAVDWLKSEIFPTDTVKAIMAKNRTDFQSGLPKDSLTDFANLLFPSNIPTSPSHSVNSRDRITDADQNAIDAFVAELPFYISTLNFFSLSLSRKSTEAESKVDAQTANAESGSATSSAGDAVPKKETPLETAAGEKLLTQLEGWTKYLNGEYAIAAESRSPSPVGSDSGSRKRKRVELEHLEALERADLFALEDAIGRVKELL